MNYDGTGDISLIAEDSTLTAGGNTLPGAHGPNWIKFQDNLSRLFYILDRRDNPSPVMQIRRIQFNGSGGSTLVRETDTFGSGVTGEITSLAVDADAGFLFWVEHNAFTIPNTPVIYRCGLSGGTPTAIVTNLWGVMNNYPPKLCFSNLANRLYIWEVQNGGSPPSRIRACFNDGSVLGTIMTGPGPGGYVSSLPGTEMHWNSKFELGRGIERVGPGNFM